MQPNKLVNNDHGNYITANFTGHPFDTVISFYYVEARFYAPGDRAFVSRDTAGMDGVNWYSYCANNPASLTDPTGMFVTWPNAPTSDNSYFIRIECMSLYTNMAYSNSFDVLGLIKSGIKGGVKSFMQTNAGKLALDLLALDMDNKNENAVLISNYISAYKGHLVIRAAGFDNRSFSFGIMFISPSITVEDINAADVVRHEYGHTYQFDLLGPGAYYQYIGIPSMESTLQGDPYYNQPWEVVADVEGGVISRTHTPEEIQAGYDYLDASIIANQEEIYKQLSGYYLKP